MSTQNPTDPTVVAVPAQAEQTEESEKKPTFVAKTKHFVKTHKKPTIAVAALVGLVGVAALAGKKEPTPGLAVSLELEPPHVSLDTEVLEPETDQQSA